MAQFIGTLKDYHVYIPTSGGKAGKGLNKTGSVQIRRGGVIKKQFRFEMNTKGSQDKAIAAAKKWIGEH